MHPKRPAATLLVGASLVSAGCGVGPFGKKQPPRVFVPPPVAVATMPQAGPLFMADPPAIAIELEPQGTIVLAAGLPPFPGPPAPPATPSKPVTRPQAPVAVVETPPAAQPPKLSQIFTPAEEAAYNRELDEILQRVRGTLALAGGKNLSAALRETVAQIRSLQTQAEQARRQDLVTAVSLARRADLLAKDLAGRLP